MRERPVDDLGRGNPGDAQTARVRALEDVDEALAARVAALTPASQRWLKTAIQTMRNAELLAPAEEGRRREPKRLTPPPRREEHAPRGADLEDVITGKADLRKQLESYPELSEELDGLADVIDMLRDLGARRRRIGERILREEILGEPPEGEEGDEGLEEET